jgi:hypothetical protein
MGLERVVARSRLAPIVYVVDAAGDDGGHKLWRAFADAEFVDLTTTPHELLGRFPDVRQAGNRAERLDFALFRQKAQSEGRAAEFVGSDAMADAAGHVPDGSFLEAASFFQAKTKSLKKNANGSWDLALTIDGDLPRWLLDSALGETLTIGAVPMGHETDPHGAEARKRVEDAIRRITLRPTEGEFQEFVLRHYDNWGLVAAASRTNSDAIAEAVHETVLRLIGVPSRTMLKTDIDAIERWEALDREYYVNMAMAKGVYFTRRPR